MGQKNHEEIIRAAYVRSLVISGTPDGEANNTAGIARYRNMFKAAEADAYRAETGHKGAVSIVELAEYIDKKYPVCTVTEHVEIKTENIMTEKKVDISTELVVDVAPGTVLNNNFSEFNAYWRGIMKAADINPQTGDDIASIREFERQSSAVEKKVAEALRLAMTGNPEIQKLVLELEELQGDSRALRLKLGKMAVSWLTDQKQAEVQKQVERVAAESGRLFTGRILKAGREFCKIVPRLENAGKGKKTLDTYADAVSAEADLIVLEMEQVAKTCNANLAAIDATDLPALFQDSVTLMMLPEDQLDAEIGRRVAEYNLQEEKKKSQVQRNPEKLAELKAEASKKNNIYHLKNWGVKHQQRIRSELPHADDLSELWSYCGELKATLEAKENERLNVPPPIHEDKHPESGPAHAKPILAEQETPSGMCAYNEHALNGEDEPTVWRLAVEFDALCTESQIKLLAGAVSKVLRSSPFVIDGSCKMVTR